MSEMRLETLAGPYGETYEIAGDAPCVLGRSAASTIRLLHGTVSRQHAAIVKRSDDWFVLDRNSTSGTIVNGVHLGLGEPARLDNGDLLQIGPWTFRVNMGARGGTRAATIDDTGTEQRIGSVSEDVSSHDRLNLLTKAMTQFSEASDADSLATVALRSAIDGSGYGRGAVLRRVDGAFEMEVLASLDGLGKAPGGPLQFSRSLVSRASGGETVFLADAPVRPYEGSIAELNIHSALCAPVRIGSSIEAYLYLDARGEEQRVRSDAAAFCEAIARAYGLSLAALKRQELERRQRTLHAELEAAREVQNVILPGHSGRSQGIDWAVDVRPGVFVAGDMFDVIDLGDRGVAISLGDVSGHGVGSALVMAMVQAQIHARMQATEDPAAALCAVNAYVTDHLPPGRFVSVWLGVFRPDGSLEFVDAGHGHWLAASEAGELSRAEHRGDIPIGIDHGATFTVERLDPSACAKILLFSDGVTERRNFDGEEFGVDRIRAAIGSGGSPTDDVARVMAAADEFGGGEPATDDATVASIARVRG